MFRKSIFVLILCVLINVFVDFDIHSKDVKESSSEKEFDFRKSYWGMTMEAVIKTEDGDPIEQHEDMIVYRDNLFGIEVVVLYEFLDDKLFRCGYLTHEQRANENDHLYDYQILKDSLIEKYGDPVIGKGLTDMTWHNDSYKNKPYRHGYAIRIGHLSRSAEWLLENTRITISICNDNHRIDVCIMYANTHLESMWLSQQKKKEPLK